MASSHQAWERDGFWLAKGLFSAEETGRYRDHFMAWNSREGREDFDALDPTGNDPLSRFPRIIHPHRRDPLSLAFLLDGRLRAELTRVLGAEPLAAQTMFYFKPPGGRGQALHQDQQYLRAVPGTCVAAWLAVDDCDQENGCLEVVPGSHRLPLLCHIEADTRLSFTDKTVPVPEGYSVRPVTMQAGDVLFFHGALIHGSGPNRTADRFRRAFIAHYVTGDARAVSRFYHPLLRFDGSVFQADVSPGGGKCGKVTQTGIEMVDEWMPGPKGPH